MHPPVSREAAPRTVIWQDLLPVTRLQRWGELTLPLPWLAASWALYASPLWPVGALASFMFFLCALRLNHEAIHGNLGLPRRADIGVCIFGNLNIQIRRDQSDFATLGAHQHIGQYRDRIAALHNILHMSQRL